MKYSHRYYWITVILIMFFAVGCMKKDVNHTLPKRDKCINTGYSSLNFYDEFTLGHGLELTYFPLTGLVKTMKTAIMLNYFNGVDSIYYSMTYSAAGVVTVNATKKHFTLVLPEPTETNPYDPWNSTLKQSDQPDENYVITGTFDIKKNRLKSISGKDGNFSITYDKDKIVSFGEWSVNWDIGRNNILSVGKDDSGEEDGIAEYYYGDETVTAGRLEAKHQRYITTGYIIHEYFNLSEACKWIPLNSKDVLLVYASYTGYNPAVGLLPAGQYNYSNHVVDANGYLQSYRMDWPRVQTIINFWECKTNSGK